MSAPGLVANQAVTPIATTEKTPIVSAVARVGSVPPSVWRAERSSVYRYGAWGVGPPWTVRGAAPIIGDTPGRK